MTHVSSPVLRRLVDEPLAVPDRARHHLAGCDRCQAHSTEIARDAGVASRLLGAAGDIPDVDLEWLLLAGRLTGPGAAVRPAARSRAPRRIAGVSVSAGTAAVASVLAVGAAAAAVLTTVYAPTHVAPLRVSPGDLRAVESITGLGNLQPSGGLPASGSRRLPFGELTWRTQGHAQQVSSVARASALAGLPLTAPASLPSGVGAPDQIVIQPQMTATVQFSHSAGGAVGGSTLQVTGGPAIAVEYGGSEGNAGLPTLAVVAARRPVARSTGATASQLAAFLLSRSGLPAGLAEELRLLGNPSTVLPVPVPPGMWVEQTHIGGAAAVLVTDSAAFASGVIWESRGGVVYAVGGLLDKEDVLNVARQVG